MSTKSYFYTFIIFICVLVIFVAKAVKVYNNHLEEQKQVSSESSYKNFMVGLHQEEQVAVSDAEPEKPIEMEVYDLAQPAVQEEQEDSVDFLDKKIEQEEISSLAENIKSNPALENIYQETQKNPKIEAFIQELKSVKTLQNRDIGSLSPQEMTHLLQTDENFRKIILKYMEDPEFVETMENITKNLSGQQ